MLRNQVLLSKIRLEDFWVHRIPLILLRQDDPLLQDQMLVTPRDFSYCLYGFNEDWDAGKQVVDVEIHAIGVLRKADDLGQPMVANFTSVDILCLYHKALGHHHGRHLVMVASSKVTASPPPWDAWRQEKGIPAFSLSNTIWPSAALQLLKS
ncbi:hypothetical protein NE237_022749 [Protea cynaroides]|uniref:Uncharacterized protein n=1 Tax=Protea cynaroides TaxID=273540 RepID=A0A9Q0K5K0_9MAGN|nr:hypothetical protein NE237_022749 [Protea cynaroides]